MSIELIKLAPKKISSSHSPQEVQKIESKIFEKALEGIHNIILLDEKGKTMASKPFSKYLQNTINRGGHSIAFVIGGAYGFSAEMKASNRQVISLSELTFAHHLARTVLLEQIYRAFTIINNEPYHNT